MNRFLCAGICLVAIMAGLVLYSPSAQATDEQDVRTISKSIKALANAVELWANAHQGKYPTTNQFYSDEFMKFVKKADPVEAKNNLCCPLSGKAFIYQRLQDEKNFIISCPRPYNYGMKKLYYERKQGIIVHVPAKDK
jgi:hypothetical protein